LGGNRQSRVDWENATPESAITTTYEYDYEDVTKYQTANNRLMMEVHYYDPYNFTLNNDSPVWQWGAIANDASATEAWANEPWVDDQFGKMKKRFVDQGVAVIVGEYSAAPKLKYPGARRYTEYWMQVVTRSMVRHGLVPVLWDTGGLIDRTTGAVRDPAVLRTLVEAAQ
jgi:endoglucanase